MERKLLVAIGNTGLDKITVNYLGNLFQDKHDVGIDLFTVVPIQGVTEAQLLLGDIDSLAQSKPSVMRKKEKALTYLASLKKILTSAGYPEELVTCEAVFSWSSVAATLLQHGQAGLYDAIILAKRDLSGLEKMLSGSISAVLGEKDNSGPLWIVSGNPTGHHFLVPVDCSLHTLNAVDHLGFILQGDKEAEITLFHSNSLLADDNITPKEDFYEKWGREWCDQHLKGDGKGHYHFHATEQILKEHNIPSEHIHKVHSESGIEPSQMIAREVKKQAYSTIVMGSRLDKEKNVFMGVSDRVMSNVDNVAIWVVG